MVKEIRYCSLDIETTGFDPLKDEILEVGFAFFTLDENGIKITEEWSQVFNPSKEVSPKILGLTGISQKELDEAPKFSERRDFIQKKIGDSVLVGHNIVFDIKFLESFGIKFSGQTIDTLELAQIFMPTHHSYNLENLMHTFEIEHKDAHRALADAKATLQVLQKLLVIYRKFPDALKKSMGRLIEGGNFLWQPLLIPQLKTEAIAKANANNLILSKKEKDESTKNKIKLRPKTIYDFPLGTNYLEEILENVQKSRQKFLLMVPRQQQAIYLWKQGKVKAFFSPENTFNEEQFSSFLGKKELTADERKFLLKVLVWKHTNWQTESILDLNLSFFGGQFRSYINGGIAEINEKHKIICCDQATFLTHLRSGPDLPRSGDIYSGSSAVALGVVRTERASVDSAASDALASLRSPSEAPRLGGGSFTFPKQEALTGRFAVIAGLAEFESAVSSKISQKVSWGQIIGILKSYYNPDFQTGSLKYQDAAIEGLEAADLFFGLVNAVLKTDSFLNFQYFKITPEVINSESYKKVEQAAGHFREKLDRLNKTLCSDSLESIIKSLGSFFEVQDNRVKWIEFSEKACIFQDCPIEIADLVQEKLKEFSKTAFIDSVGSKTAASFLVSRLGLESYKFQTADIEGKKAKPKVLKDLFSNFYPAPTQEGMAVKPQINTENKSKSIAFKTALEKAWCGVNQNKERILCRLRPQSDILQNLSEVLTEESLPAAVLLGSSSQVKEFHETSFAKLKPYAHLLVQNSSGGSGKIFHNFSIHQDSILLASDRFVLKHIFTSNSTKLVENLKIKTLVISHLPFEQFAHPYSEAVASKYANPFMEFSLPKAMYNFHRIIGFFKTSELREVYICDAKIKKDYFIYFLDYLKAIPGISISN